jgi:hypothetical protein
MVYVTCDNEECLSFGIPMKCTDTDDRQEWCEWTYECEECGKIKIQKQWRDQIGLIVSDEIYDDQ